MNEHYKIVFERIVAGVYECNLVINNYYNGIKFDLDEIKPRRNYVALKTLIGNRYKDCR